MIDAELADRLEAGYDRCSGIPDALLMAYNGHTHNVSTIAESDLEAAAVRLREQDAEIENLKAANALAVGHLVNVDDLPELTRPPHPHSASLFMAGMLAQRERDDARLRKLDRIEAALGDVWTADEIRWAVGDGRVVKMAYYPLGGYAEDHDGHYWRLAPTGTGHRARSRACADPNCLWLVVIMFDPSSATWTLLHECDGDRTVTSSGHTTWQEASRHAFKLDVPHREVCG
jgi:predicted RNA-binding Zn ribbon-like protein